jgi:hypothetical protein
MDDDERPLPTAEELGISEAEYQRILRGLDLAPEQIAATVRSGPDPGRDKQGVRWEKWPLVLTAAILVVILVPRFGLVGGKDYPPTYEFLQAVDGQPVTYSSCSLIQVAVYPAGGPSNAEQLVREAVAKVEAATGLDIVVVGSYGGHAPNWNFEAAPVTYTDPVSVSWQDGNAIAAMTEDTAGLGGSPVVTSVNGTQRRVAGTIALSRDYYAQLQQRGDHAEEVAVLLHEFGHVMGLGHVDSPHELMYEDNVGQTEFGAGDLEGLRRLGQGPCVS